MDFDIKLFATLKDRAGQARILVSVPAPATVGTLLTETAERYPQLAPALPTVLVAVNKAYSSRETPLETGDEVALFPPVSERDWSLGPETAAVTVIEYADFQ